ncbi:MAG: NAD(P)-dependent oxidoreductase, partial [Calditrichaeota bacterium]
MKIAVTGGFGFIGRNIVKRLLDDGHEINILSHNNKSKGLFKKDVTIYNGSIKAVDSL